MTMPNGSSLAPHVHNWIGGDIGSLRELAAKLRAYVPHIQDLAGRLTVVAEGLTCDGPNGWQGKAADGFMATWDQQTRAVTALGDYVAAVATAVGSLPVELSHVEHALEEQARVAVAHGVKVGDDGTVIAYAGAKAFPYAEAYEHVRQQALASADSCRTACAQQLNDLYQRAFNPNEHPDSADYATLADVFANLAAVPTSARRDITAKMKKLQGQNYKLDRDVAEARSADKPLQEVLSESAKVRGELNQVQEELKATGRTENALSKLLDTRTSDVNAYLEGRAGPGRHVAGNTPEDLRAAASKEPGMLRNALELAESTPVVDVAATAVGTGIGTYYDVQDGQSMTSALPEEIVANTAGTVATNAATGITGAAIGTRLGAVGGPVGVAAGAVVGYAVGDYTHNMIANWDHETHDHGLVHGALDDADHSANQTVDDGRELITGTGHKIEQAWDGIVES